jgi:regulator of replication initiation timing
MNITIEDLLRAIGSLYIENQMLRAENQALKAAIAQPAAKAAMQTKKPKDPPTEAA